MREQYDVVVVGGGPSGALAAKTLTEGGVKVCLIEKDLSHNKPCGGGTPSTSFEEFKLPQNEIVRKIGNVSTIAPSGFRIDVSFNSGYLAMVERKTFDNTLRELTERAGAVIREAEFLKIKENEKKVCVTVAEKGMEKDIASDFLIAADGVNSRVAGAIGLKPLQGVYTIQEDVDLQTADDFKDLNACEFWFGSSHAPNFYSWVFPKKDYVDIGTGSFNGKILKEIMNNFKMRRGVQSAGRQRVYRLPLKWRDVLVRENILFTGDAAGLVMPLSYEGIYYAMKSGKMAAEAIISGKPRDYERQWNKKFLKQYKLMRALSKYFMRNDRLTEEMVSIHKRKEIQEASFRLWLEKDMSLSSFFSYFSFFRKLL